MANVVEDVAEHNTSHVDASLAKNNKHPLEHKVDEEKGENVEGGGNRNQNGDEDEDEDEEEDVDFNPLLKESPSREASSSLSSEIEGFDADIADSAANVSSLLATDFREKPSNPVWDCTAGETDRGEEVVTQASPLFSGAIKEGPESGSLHEKSDASGNKTNIDNQLVVAGNMGNSKKPIMIVDGEDAICMRTRARYSLASFTLDELETFLQETDDEDDLQNVDDEEEYRKFLAAVLLGGDGDSQNVQENENVDDEDEENDADFELEIEEALESDVDEETRDEIQEQVYGRRPKTRQNRHQKASAKGKKKIFEQLKRPLRPILPSVPLAQRPSFSALDGKSFVLNHASEFLPPGNDGSINGFTPHQIGQLHCLIHEHVQLLIQVFSICVLEPSRQHVAAKVQELILEMLCFRDHILAWRRLPYPSFCFFPPYIHPSVPSKIFLPPCVNGSSSGADIWRSCPSGNNLVPPDIISNSKGRRECLRNGQHAENSGWVPYIDSPVLSVLDVAPLKLVGNYVDDVSAVVQEYHRRQVGVASDTRFEREPLFPLHNYHASAEPHDQVSRGTADPASILAHSSSKNDQPPKKTMASALVERAKKQSVAPVPKEISKLAQRFFVLFNPALYPHKPPPAPVANRVLFTEAEDELLAMGLMEYNTDWKAIQHRFLPTKTKHQIFVRQKNRSSSKAPENPIKAVRRMKNSPLTTEEIARIEEGLKIFKLDWMSIWKLVVPYRDPSLLPRQWRIANGTQKSYKSDANKKEKRRLYELTRRNCKPAALPSCHTSSVKELQDHCTEKASEENNNRINQVGREDEAYVHEAFLADWRPNNSYAMSKAPDIGPAEKSLATQPLPECSQARENVNNSGIRDSQPPLSNEIPTVVRSSISQSRPRPYRARRIDHARLVKLAPDLPPVNLPPSVRVMSESAFKSYKGGVSLKACSPDSAVIGSGAESRAPNVVKGTANSGPLYPVKAGQIRSILVNNDTTNQQPEDSLITRNKNVTEEKDDSDLQMHPLLFQAPEYGRFPYYSSNSSANTSSSFKFFSGSPTQLNLTLFHNQRSGSHVNFDKSLKPKESTSASFGVDFHPLLQRADDPNCITEGGQSDNQFLANLEASRDRCTQVKNQLGATLRASCVSSSTAASTRPVSPKEKINELDLDIHLSFTSRRQRALGSRDIRECSVDRSSGSPLDSSLQVSKKPKNSLHQSSHHGNASFTLDRNISKFDSGIHPSAALSDEENLNNVDKIVYQSLPEIVMEQEELSDSEDEIGENVEFECEEMADSEAEGSDSEQIADVQDEEVQKVDMNTDFCVQQFESSVEGSPDVIVTSEGHSKDRKMDNSSSLYLNLNSCPPGSLAVEPKSEVSRHISSSSEKGSSYANKSTENSSISNHATAQEQDMDPTEQPNQHSSITSLGKLRKRECSTDSRLSRGRPKRKMSSLDDDTTSVSSKNATSKGENFG